MSAWWSELTLALQLFYGIGGLALAVLIATTLLSLVTGHHDVDLGGGDHSDGFGFLSIRSIAAFFVGFGWAGAFALSGSGSIPIAVVAGLLAGTVLLAANVALVRSMLKLQDSGTLSYKNAIGQVGTVYSTIPANRAAAGQIEVLVQSRLIIAEAYTVSPADLKPGSKVRVTGLVGTATLEVEPAFPQT